MVMKNSIIKFFAVLVVIALTVSFAACSINNSGIDDVKRSIPDGVGYPELSEERIRIEEKSNMAYNNILKSFEISDNEMVFDDIFAGAYLNDEGKLVVLITSSSDFESATAVLKDRAKDTDLLFEETKYSYAHLNELMKQLNGVYLENYLNPDSIWSQVTGFSLFDDKNCITVEILAINDSKIKRFASEVNDSEVIRFKNSNDFLVNEATYPGGYASGGSIGYRAHRYLGNNQWEYGFVTCGHGRTSGQNITNSNGTVIGTCTNALQYNSYLDAAFVKTATGYDTSRYTSYGYYLSGSYALPAQNSTIYKEGQQTGWSSGTVLSNSTSQTVSGIAMIDVLTSNYNSDGGDSGSVVYTPSNIIVGVHIAGPAGGGAGTRVVTKAGNISTYINVQPD